MAIANDMIMAVASEENTNGATEFSVHNVVWIEFGGWVNELESQLPLQDASCRP